MLVRIIKFLIKNFLIKLNPVGYARSIGVILGKNTFIIDLQSATFGSEPYLVQLGDNVEVTSGVRFITHDGGVWVGRKQFPEIDVIAPIKVGSNVFIGINTIILPGVTIGDNVVIGAGSIVTRDVESNTVVAGVPAKIIKSTGQYLEESLERSLDIHLMSRQEKKSFLMQIYNLKN